jgi:hypothetical protein
MSRTDKTSPYIVRLWHGSLRRQACHDHSSGDCDLPPTLRDDLASGGSTRCSWAMRDDGTRIGAAFRGDLAYARAERKGERSRARVRLGEALKTFRAAGEWND